MENICEDSLLYVCSTISRLFAFVPSICSGFDVFLAGFCMEMDKLCMGWY